MDSQNGNLEIDKNGKITVKSDANNGDSGAGWDEFVGYFADDNIVAFMNEKIKPYFDTNAPINQATLEDLIVGADVLNSNSTTYDIDVEEAREIIKYLNIILKANNPSAEPYRDDFLDSYTDRTWFNKGKGMKQK